jgi:Glycosyl hydrolase family 26/S-layer homology domain
MTHPSWLGWRAPRLQKPRARFAPGFLLVLTTLVMVFPTATAGQVEEGAVIVPTEQLAAGLYPPSQWAASDHLLAVSEESGKNLSLGGLWLNVNEPTDNVIHQLDQVWLAGATPFVNIHVDWPPVFILSGSLDSDIANFGAAIGKWLALGEGRAVLLAPMPEMNGDWVPYGMDPAQFGDAYRRFRSVAAQSGAQGRVRWVFAPNGWSTPPHQMADYYPGADVVDLVGFSAYNWGSGQVGFQWTAAPATLCHPLNEARGFAREKPFLVAQTASATTGGDREAWIASMFDFLTDDPNAVGFLYFDIDKERDWAIYENGTLPAQWQQGMQSAQTTYQFPIENWFAPGPLVVDSVNEVYPGCIGDIEKSQFQFEIKWLLSTEITVGCGNSLFCPTRGVTRGQMASFLARALNLPVAAADYFSDDTGSIYEADINRVAAAGITGGCAAGSYCPASVTTRAQMATFLTRSLGLPGSPTDYFNDDLGSVHEGDINAVALAGITLGCTANTFCPDATVTREQMAAFLYRTFS